MKSDSLIPPGHQRNGRTVPQRGGRTVGAMLPPAGPRHPVVQEFAHARPLASHLDDLVAVPDLMAVFDRQIRVAQRLEGMLAAHDVANECEHGHLPTDPTITCGCWSRNGSVTAPEPAAPPRGKYVGPDGRQHFTCEACGQEWTRPATRGMPPKRCPTCRGAA